MNRLWSLLFLSVPVMGMALVLAAALGAPHQYWLPESIGPRTESIDSVFNLFHGIVGVVFAATGLLLAFALWRFRGDRPNPASPRHGSLALEFLWTLVPAGMLGWMAFYQAGFWNQNKVADPVTYQVNRQGEVLESAPTARVLARQFDWTFVYPGRDGRFDTRDDVVAPGVLTVPVDEVIVLELRSEDVIHSFAINALRLKQDIVPALNTRIWFEAAREGTWEINCTELCGWGHYRMAAQLQVVSRDEFDRRTVADGN